MIEWLGDQKDLVTLLRFRSAVPPEGGTFPRFSLTIVDYLVGGARRSSIGWFHCVFFALILSVRPISQTSIKPMHSNADLITHKSYNGLIIV